MGRATWVEVVRERFLHRRTRCRQRAARRQPRPQPGQCPGAGVSANFDEPLRPWEGTMQAIYSDQFSDLDGSHFGAKMESAPLHPAILALVTPWRGAAPYNRLMRALPNMSLVGVLLRDRDGGGVQARDGTARVRYRLSDYDQRHM